VEAMNIPQKELKRPGGFLITERAISICRFPTGAKILDLGCGSGATVEYLINNYGFDVSGIDIKLEQELASKNLIKASSGDIPFPDMSAEGIIMECSFSLMESQAEVLRECFRVLKKEGKLIISDMYAKGEPAELSGSLGRIETKGNIISLLEENLLEVEHFEDFSHHLQSMWGQMIFNKGAESFYCSLGVSPEVFKKVNCGYYLLIASKREKRI
jgi:ubiquinone/menaquinone biosynthesis C-methylase UbiE